MKAKKHNLIYGIKLDGNKVAPLTDYISSYELTLLEPVDDIDSITIAPPTLGDGLAASKKVAEDYFPGTDEYTNALFDWHVAKRCTPAPSEEQLKRMAAPDYDALRRVVEGGINPETGKRAYALTDSEGVVATAYTRLPMQSDRRNAEQWLDGSVRENLELHEAYLSWFVVRFGQVSEADFGKKQPIEFSEFLKIGWADFLVIARGMLMRDYKPLTEILEGKVEVDGKTVPFQGVPETDGEEHKPKGKRGAATAA